MIIQKEKGMEQTYFSTKERIRKSERIVNRQNCMETASSCNMDIVEDLTLRYRY